MQRTHAGEGQQSEEEGVAERSSYGLTMNLIPYPSCSSEKGDGTGRSETEQRVDDSVF